MNQIPIIDMEEINEIPNGVNSNETWILTANKVREGLGNIGFVYLKNHGIDTSIITKAFRESQKFFGLDQEIKLKYKKGQSLGEFNAYTGYSEPGQQLLHPSSMKELRESYDGLQRIGVHPDSEVPDFKKAFKVLFDHCSELAKKVLVLWAISLKLEDPKYFLNCCINHDNLSFNENGTIRALHYPPVPSYMDVGPGTVRLGEHSDYGLLTFLFQDMVGGLEVQAVNGQWIEAKPIPDTILVNTGDLLEFWSSGVFPATKHRVMVPDNPTQKYADRYSIACFVSPNAETIVTSLKVEKTESEKIRLATTSHPNYDEMEPVNGMEYIMRRLVTSYAKSFEE